MMVNMNNSTENSKYEIGEQELSLLLRVKKFEFVMEI